MRDVSRASHELRRSESKGEIQRAEQSYKRPERSEGNGNIVGFITKEPPVELVVNPQ